MSVGSLYAIYFPLASPSQSSVGPSRGRRRGGGRGGGLEHIQASAATIPIMSHRCPATPVAAHGNLWLSGVHS